MNETFFHTERLQVGAVPIYLPSGMPVSEVRLITPLANAGAVFLSPSEAAIANPSNRFTIPAGMTLTLHISQLSRICFWGTAGDFLDMFVECKHEE